MNSPRRACLPRLAPTFLLLLCATRPALASRPKPHPTGADPGLATYLARLATPTPLPPSPGGAASLWRPHGALTNMASDVQALRKGDLITIHVLENTVAEGDGSIKSQRNFSAQSGLSEALGVIGPRSGLANLFSPSSNETLDGQGQTNTTTQLTTDLTGQVVAVLPNGVLVVEARRSVEINNERQTAILRGLVRPADVAADNSILSTSLGDLEVELLGKGVVSDITRQPNLLTRILLKIFQF
ncbi:MAG: flagellar basal body L-ring protein FlgH [Terriglobales bacterium]